MCRQTRQTELLSSLDTLIGDTPLAPVNPRLIKWAYPKLNDSDVADVTSLLAGQIVAGSASLADNSDQTLYIFPGMASGLAWMGCSLGKKSASTTFACCSRDLRVCLMG